MSSVVVRIAGDDSQLQAALSRAQKGMGRFQKDIKKMIPAFNLYRTAVAGVGAVLSGVFIARHAQAIDSTAKFSDQIGISTKELTQFQHAASEAANVTDKTFNMALRRMTRRIAEAANGAGPAAKTIKELGLSAQELKDEGPAQALRTISDALKDTRDQGDRLRIAFSLFDTDGGALLPMLQGGSEALREYANEADALGKSFDRIDAAQVEAANSAMQRIRNIITGIGTQLAIQLAPYIEEVASRFTSLGKNAGGIGSIISSVIASVLKGFAKVGNVIRGVQVAMKGVLAAAQGVGTGIINVTSLIYEGWNRIFEMIFAGISGLVKQANRIPGINIPTDGLDNLRKAYQQTAQAQVEFRKQATESLKQTLSELHDAAMEPLPSQAVEDYLEGVKERSRAAAEEIAAAKSAMTFDGIDTDDSEVDEKERERQERALDAIRNRYLTEQELLRQHQETMMLIGEEYDVAKFETEAEWRSIREQAEQDHMDKLADIRERGLSRIEKFQAMSFRAQVANVSSALADMTAGVANENKKMFELNKAAGIANAIVSAYQGIATTMGTYPFPLSVAMAAAQGAAAFAQVSAIRSQSFGGGGGAAPSLAGSTPAPPVTPVGSGAPQQAQTMRVEGLSADALFSGSFVETFANKLLDFQKDGGQVVFAG